MAQVEWQPWATYAAADAEDICGFLLATSIRTYVCIEPVVNTIELQVVDAKLEMYNGVMSSQTHWPGAKESGEHRAAPPSATQLLGGSIEAAQEERLKAPRFSLLS